MVEKRVENSIELSQSQQEILRGISNFLTIKEIAKYRKCSKQAIYKAVYLLCEKGLIRKIGNIYELTERGIEWLNSLTKLSSRLRLHNLKFKILILSSQKNWDLKRSKIALIRNLSKEINLNNNNYQIHTFRNIKVQTTTKSVIFNMPSFYGLNTEDCLSQALEMLFNSIPKVETLFKIGLIKDKKANIEIISHHYAKLQDSLAKIYKTENNKLYVKDENGEIWLIADFSFKTSELETISTINAKEDMDTVSGFLNDLRKNPATFTQVLELIKQVTANQVIFDKNMKSHIDAIQNLSKGVKKLTKVMGGILRENRDLKLKSKHQLTLLNYEN